MFITQKNKIKYISLSFVHNIRIVPIVVRKQQQIFQLFELNLKRSLRKVRALRILRTSFAYSFLSSSSLFSTSMLEIFAMSSYRMFNTYKVRILQFEHKTSQRWMFLYASDKENKKRSKPLSVCWLCFAWFGDNSVSSFMYFSRSLSLSIVCMEMHWSTATSIESMSESERERQNEQHNTTAM